jgi:hypothetical protein
VHAFFVKEASTSSKLAAALQKLLDKRYSNVIARLDRCADDVAREELWRQELDAGRIAGAYWAFVTDTRVPKALFTRIFGEVHMLSHVHGRIAHQNLSRLSELQSELDSLESRSARLSARNRDLSSERDAAVAALADLRSSKAAIARADPRPAIQADTATRIARRERALLASRERARAAEQMVRLLEEKLARLSILLEARDRVPAAICPAALACEETIRADTTRRVLYVGGRSGMTEQLRRVASGLGATLILHDGGLEQAVARIDSIVEGCDAVFCPIDCVSHAACLKAKNICKRLGKPFIPLRSSGAATFARALSSLADN